MNNEEVKRFVDRNIFMGFDEDASTLPDIMTKLFPDPKFRQTKYYEKAPKYDGW